MLSKRQTTNKVQLMDNSRSIIFQVSYPTSPSVGRLHGDFTYCTNTGSTSGQLDTCNYICLCEDDGHCSDILIFAANADQDGYGSSWSLCELMGINT